MNNFDQYYNAFIGEIAAKGEKLDSICKNQQVMTDSLNNQRKVMYCFLNISDHNIHHEPERYP